MVALALVAAALALPAFTTAPQQDPGSGGQAVLSKVAVACRGSFDRFVVTARKGVPAYDARYVKRIRSDGSGDVVALKGRKRLRLVFPSARAHRASGGPLLPGTLTPKCPALRQVKLAGDFEGVVTFGLGLKGRAGFRVFRLADPTRVVVDVAH